jgi:hypothetical protein
LLTDLKVPNRTRSSEVILECTEQVDIEIGDPTAKRRRTDHQGSIQNPSENVSITESIATFAAVLAKAVHS